MISTLELPVMAVALQQKVEDMRPCFNCGGLQVFVAEWAMDAGMYGYCSGCGEEKLVRWTRTNSEAA